MLRIDLNCDVGESYGRYKLGHDEALFPHISSCNVACGFHAGDPLVIEKTLRLALEHDVQIGAHPSFPDRQGFGRRNMQLSVEEIYTLCKYQIAALKGMTESLGGKLSHVKAHGALYHAASNHKAISYAIVEAILAIDPALFLVGPPGSCLQSAAAKKNCRFVREAFADRAYNDKLGLINREQEGAMLESPETVWQQVKSILFENQVHSLHGKTLPIQAETLCVHGDNPYAPAMVKYIREELDRAGVQLQAYAR